MAIDAPGSGQWSPARHLASGYFSIGGARSMAADGGTIHFVMWNGGVHYRQSVDAGQSWNPPVVVTPRARAQAMPALVKSGTRLHLSWQDGRDSGDEPYAFRIYHTWSEDGGRTWSQEVRATSAEAKSFRHALAVCSETIHEFWMDKRHNTIPDAFSTDGNWEIYTTRSTGGGTSWGPDRRLTEIPEMVCGRPAVGIAGSTILVAFVAWEECGRGTLDGAFGDIYTVRSTDGGDTWGPVVRFTDTPYQATHPQVFATAAGILGIVWEEGRRYDFDTKIWNGPTRLYVRRSADLGQTWGPARQLNGGDDATHALAYHSGERVHVTWTDRIDGRKATCWACSPDGGSTWTAPECLTSDGNWWAGPSCATSDRVIAMMHPDGQTEAYCRVLKSL